MEQLLGLRWVREARGYSQEELAELSGVTQARISLLERGRAKARRATIRRLADALECRQLDLIRGPH